MKYSEYLIKMRGFSPRTVEVYLKYAHLLDYYELSYERLLIELPDYAANTRRLVCAAIKSYYKFLGDARAAQITLPKREIKIKDHVSYAMYQQYLQVLSGKTKSNLQKRLVVRLLYETGLRASELIQIKKSDINLNTIKILGKGRRERIVKISEWLRSELTTYAALVKTERLFNFGYKNLYKKIQSLDPNVKLNPHMFRRGYAKHCYEAGASIYDISLSMGHSSIDTTSAYIKRDSNDVELYKLFN